MPAVTIAPRGAVCTGELRTNRTGSINEALGRFDGIRGFARSFRAIVTGRGVKHPRSGRMSEDVNGDLRECAAHMLSSLTRDQN